MRHTNVHTCTPISPVHHLRERARGVKIEKSWTRLFLHKEARDLKRIKEKGRKKESAKIVLRGFLNDLVVASGRRRHNEISQVYDEVVVQS